MAAVLIMSSGLIYVDAAVPEGLDEYMATDLVGSGSAGTEDPSAAAPAAQADAEPELEAGPGTFAEALAREYRGQKGSFILNGDSRFYIVADGEPDGELTDTVRLIDSQFAAYGIPSEKPMPVVYGKKDFARKGDIVVSLVDEEDFLPGIKTANPEETYRIDIDETAAVEACGQDGIWYGLIELMQLCLEKRGDAVVLDRMRIKDGPDLKERAVMLDCGRKYFSKEWIENLIRRASLQRYNAIVLHFAEAEGIRLKGMADELKRAVVAQDPAIDKIVKAIQRNRVGLREPNHPIGVFMFLGPTGVGKTYLAKKLAEFMFGSSEALIRIDMSEYTEAFNTSRLIGAPPGYVGYEEGGQLTERVRRKPYSIVLLDEIEKAHPNVYNMLLQVLDEGRLTDGNGRLVDFRNTVIIMTSNAGTRQLKEFGRGVGFTAGGQMGLSIDDRDKEYARSIIQKALSKQFAPEFLNRLDEIVTFDQLDIDAIKRIVDIELKGLYERIGQMGYQLNISNEAKEFVATKGYDVQFGARPLKRAIQNYIEDGVCERIIDGELTQGSTINISKHPEKDELVFE